MKARLMLMHLPAPLSTRLRAFGISLFAAAVLASTSVTAAAADFDVQRVVSPGGVEAWLIEDHSNPIVSIDFAFSGGAAADPEGREGLAALTAGLLTEGAGDMDSRAFRETLADKAIRLSFDAGRDSMGGSLRTLTDTLDEAVRLTALALTAPRFDPEAVERAREQALASLRARRNDPRERAWQRLYALMFEGHPYARPTRGTPEGLGAVTADDMRDLVSRLGRDGLVIGVSGAIDGETLSPVLDRLFAELPAQSGMPEIPLAEPRAEDGLEVIDLPVPQSVAILAQPGLLRHDPDWYTALVVNHILGGGGFTSRLVSEVRSRRGLAYSVSTGLVPMERGGLVVAQVASGNETVAEAVAAIREEWRRMAEEGPTPEEVEDAKTYLIGSFPLQFDSTARTASILTEIQRLGLPIDILERRREDIAAITPEDARRVAARLLDEISLTVVVAGRPVGLTGQGDEAP